MTEPPDRDIDQLLAKEGYIAPDGLRLAGAFVELGKVRQLMRDAWYFGYTTGMGDSAKLDEKVRARSPGVPITDVRPVTRAHCVPDCDWLRVRGQHAPGCQQ